MEHCIDIRDIPNLADLPAGDPRRRHLDACPRCRGLAEAHGLFMEPGATTDLEGLADADVELQRRLTEALAARSTARARSPRRRLWLALAAVLALCAVGLTTTEVLRLRNGAPPRVGERLRGDTEATGLAASTQNGTLHLAWTGAPAADAYVYVLFGADLVEIARHAGPEPTLALATVDLPAAAGFCQALAVSQGDTLARSTLIPILSARE